MFNTLHSSYVYIVHSIQYYLPFAFRIYMRWYEIQEHMYIWYYMKFKKSSRNASTKNNTQHIISFVTTYNQKRKQHNSSYFSKVWEGLVGNLTGDALSTSQYGILCLILPLTLFSFYANFQQKIIITNVTQSLANGHSTASHSKKFC